MALNSRLIQLSDWCLVEYIYNSKDISTTVSDFTIIDNKYVNENQLVNDDLSKYTTGNVLDFSASEVSGSRWVHHDRDRPIAWLEHDTINLPYSKLSDVTANTWNVTYDTVRVHILSGYTFSSDVNGMIINVFAKDSAGSDCNLGSHVHINGDENIEFSKNPIYISSRVYDRYIEFDIPSLFWMISEYSNNPNKDEEIAYYFTKNNVGFVSTGLIYIDLYEIESLEEQNPALYLNTSNKYSVSFEQEDQFSNLSAVLTEVDDYFEYYPTWNGGFVEDYINQLNAIQGDFYVIHELIVSEQVGYSEYVTKSSAEYQEDGFDSPSTFRPVIKNSENAFSFSIDYVMRFVDRSSGKQVIRRSSITSFNPKKYGKQIQKIQLDNPTQPQKIYNKKVTGPELKMPSLKVESGIQKVYFPSFYDKTNITVSTSKMYINNIGDFVQESLFEWDVIFGQGEATILLSPFDNYLYFKILKTSNDSITPVNLSTDNDISIVFKSGQNRTYRYTRFKSAPFNLLAGEVLFRIPATDSYRILQEDKGEFYITLRGKTFVRCKVKDNISSDIAGKEVVCESSDYMSKSDSDMINVTYKGTSYAIYKKFLEEIEIVPDGLGGDETVLYTGTWDSMDKIDEVQDKINSTKDTNYRIKLTELKTREERVKMLEDLISKRNTELTSREDSLAALQSQLTTRQGQLDTQGAQLSNLERDIAEKSKLLKQKEDAQKVSDENSKKSENQTMADLKSTIMNLQNELEKLRKTPPSTNSQEQVLNDTIKRLTDELTTLFSKRSTDTGYIKVLQETIEALEKELNDLKKKNNKTTGISTTPLPSESTSANGIGILPSDIISTNPGGTGGGSKPPRGAGNIGSILNIPNIPGDSSFDIGSVLKPTPTGRIGDTSDRLNSQGKGKSAIGSSNSSTDITQFSINEDIPTENDTNQDPRLGGGEGGDGSGSGNPTSKLRKRP